jgi:hypothetical protein
MLIKTTQEYQAYIPVNASLSIAALQTHIRTAEYRWLKPILGDALYAQLVADYSAGSSDAKHLALLDMARRVCAPFSFFLYLPFLQANVSDAGIRVAINENMRSAAKWQVEKLDEAAELQGYMAVEELLAFLEANKADYSTWAYSPPSAIIPTALDFDVYVSIDASRLVYLKLAPHIRNAETAISRIVSKAQMNALRTALAGGSPSEEVLELKMHVAPAIAHRAFAKGIVGLPVRFDGSNVRVFASQFPGGSDFAPRVQADNTMLQQLARLHSALADEAEAKLSAFLYENHADYPEYGASTAYTAPSAPANTNSKQSGWFFA